MSNPAPYTLQVGRDGEERLNILNDIYNSASQKFLQESGLKPGMRVLEVGAGTGEMASWVAKFIGPQGHITLVDGSEAQLQIARDNFKQAGLTNAEFCALSVYELHHLEQKYDLIYSRWLLMHLTNLQAAMTSMKSSLKMGGILVVEDGANEGCFANPYNPVFHKWLEAWRTRFDFYHKDCDTGLKLHHLLRQYSFKNLKASLFQPLLVTASEKRVVLLNAIESQQAILDSGFLDKTGYEEFILQLDGLVKDETVIGYLRNMQISGIKQ